MFSGIMPCCSCYYRKCLNPNETLYLEVRNTISIYVYIYLQYKVNGKTTVKRSPPFGKGKFKRLTFPSDASDVLFRVYNCKTVPPDIICGRIISSKVSSCYKVTRTASGIQCIDVSC